MPTSPHEQILGKLSIVDRFLPIWIIFAIVSGILIGQYFPQTGTIIGSIQIYSVSLPIAIGLIWMIYPPLAGVNYGHILRKRISRRVTSLSIVLNLLVGPFLMFGLAWLFLPGLPLLRDGIILIGLARCIAMVLVWNTLAGGDNEYAAIMVALNAVFQIALYSVYAYLFIAVLPGIISHSGNGSQLGVSPILIAKNVSIFLGIPLIMGFITRILLQNRKKEEDWYDRTFLRKLKPTALIGLLFTLVLIFSLQGNYFVQLPVDLIRVAIPLFFYFIIMFGISFYLSWRLGFSYRDTVTTSFTAASNNFELAIAVAVATFGINSMQAFATTVGPLIEVPVMVALVYVSLWLKSRFHFPEFTQNRIRIKDTKEAGET